MFISSSWHAWTIVIQSLQACQSVTLISFTLSSTALPGLWPTFHNVFTFWTIHTEIIVAPNSHKGPHHSVSLNSYLSPMIYQQASNFRLEPSWSTNSVFRTWWFMLFCALECPSGILLHCKICHKQPAQESLLSLS